MRASLKDENMVHNGQDGGWSVKMGRGGVDAKAKPVPTAKPPMVSSLFGNCLPLIPAALFITPPSAPSALPPHGLSSLPALPVSHLPHTEHIRVVAWCSVILM